MKTDSNWSKLTSLLLSAALLMAIMFNTLSGAFTVAAADGDFARGSGIDGSPYIIETAEQLDKVRDYLGSYFKLGKDIDLTDYLAYDGDGYDKWGNSGWLPIGDVNHTFKGTFDGADCKITGM